MPENKERSDENISEKPDEIKKDNNNHPVSKTDEKKSSDDKSDNKKTPLKKKRNRKKIKKDKPDKDTSDKEKSDKDDSEQQKSDDESDAEKTDEEESDDKKSDEDESDKKKSDKKKKEKKHRLSKLARKAAKKAAVYTVKKTEKVAKDALNSNYRSTNVISNTGAQSVELTKKTAKTTVKTAKTTVKTVKKTINTVKNAPKNIRKAVKKTKRAVKTAVKVVKATVKAVKVTVKVIAKLIAWLSNPVVLLIVLAFVVVAYILFAYLSVLGGAAAGEANTKQAYSQAAGLGDVPKEFQQGLQVLNTCKENMKNEYAKWINNHLHYDENNKRQSDLVYMVRYDKDNNSYEVFKTDFATGDLNGGRKKELIDALDWNCGVDEAEILSIAYVLEQKSRNEITPEAEYRIYTVTYTENLINKVLCNVVEWKDSHVDHDQKCPSENCVKTIVRKKNDEYKKAEEQLQRFKNGKSNLGYIQGILNDYRDNYLNDSSKASEAVKGRWKWVRDELDKWSSDYGKNDFGSDYSVWWGANYDISGFESNVDNMINWLKNDKLPNTQEYFEDPQYSCDKKHTTYSEVLEFYNKDEIMSMLAFNDTDKYWQHLTEQYLRTFSTPTP